MEDLAAARERRGQAAHKWASAFRAALLAATAAAEAREGGAVSMVPPLPPTAATERGWRRP